MFANRLFLALLMVVSAAVSQSAQAPQSRFIWDNTLVNCGSNNGSISCVVTQKDRRQLTFKHKELTVSLSHGWSAQDLRVIVTVENAGDTGVPVNVQLWKLTQYDNLEDLKAELNANRTSPAKSPYSISNGVGMLDMGTSGLPSNAPVERTVTRTQTTNPSTGQILNPNTKVMSSTVGGLSTMSSRPVRRYGRAPLGSATKWTEVARRTSLTGEVRFPYDRGATFVAVSLNVNGTEYIYRLARH